MFRNLITTASWSMLALGVALVDVAARSEVKTPITVNVDRTWLWIDPSNRIDTFYGLGSKERKPATEFTFVEEDTDGINPKYVVVDSNGVQWKIKIGLEARPEIAATRLLWAAGYHTHEDYFVPELRVLKLPKDLDRGKDLIGPRGVMKQARLRRFREHEKKVGWWNWSDSPFLNTREFNGLRTIMALLNNWDTKDTNTAIYDNWRATQDRPVRMYMASDVGSSFGDTRISWNQKRIKGNLEYYRRSKFITSTTPTAVSFSASTRFRIHNVTNATAVHYFFRRPRQWITKEIPREDAAWIGRVLAKLSPEQLRNIFRAAGYPPEEAAGFAHVLQERIGQLCAL
jgi:hypothetical protein